MADSHNPTGNTATTSSGKETSKDHISPWVDFWLLVVMLALAIAGVAISQIEVSGGKYYWLFLVVVFGLISVIRTFLKAKKHREPVWPTIRDQVLHWAGTLVAINIVLLFESQSITDRGPASDFSLLILALSCFLAGVHFSWPFMLLGGVLAVIAVGLGFLDQLSIFAFAIPVAALSAWVVLRRAWSSKS